MPAPADKLKDLDSDALSLDGGAAAPTAAVAARSTAALEESSSILSMLASEGEDDHAAEDGKDDADDSEPIDLPSGMAAFAASAAASMASGDALAAVSGIDDDDLDARERAASLELMEVLSRAMAGIEKVAPLEEEEGAAHLSWSPTQLHKELAKYRTVTSSAWTDAAEVENVSWGWGRMPEAKPAETMTAEEELAEEQLAAEKLSQLQTGGADAPRAGWVGSFMGMLGRRGSAPPALESTAEEEDAEIGDAADGGHAAAASDAAGGDDGAAASAAAAGEGADSGSDVPAPGAAAAEELPLLLGKVEEEGKEGELPADAEVEMSLCGDAFKHMKEDSIVDMDAVFQASQVRLEEFLADPLGMIGDKRLVLRVDGRFCDWEVAGPLLLARMAFGARLSLPALEQRRQEKRRRSWRNWFFRQSSRDSDIGSSDGEGSSSPRSSASSAAATPTGSPALTPAKVATPPRSDDAASGKDGRHFRKTLRPPMDVLRELDLQPGSNTLTFTVTSGLQGTRQVSCTLYLWHVTSKIVVSDVDGTITRSDVLGHLLPAVGRDWSHAGVTKLYSDIHANGYKLLYLTSRAIGHTSLTKGYLRGLQQDAVRLPQGPVILSPDRLLASFAREVIFRRPQEFKIAALRDVRNLFPDHISPFYAGFGNRPTDLLAYVTAGISASKIFIINPRGEVRQHSSTYSKTYGSINAIVDDMFPTVSEEVTLGRSGLRYGHRTAERQEFNDYNFWQLPKPDISDLLEDYFAEGAEESGASGSGAGSASSVASMLAPASP
eukprot:PLAT10580.1.p1 GENE.PLAT10580.1~~PLAT10580.1.p1  ORF type:complete len:914 (-),score=399.64 PLAT10580.1:92-2428(-)